MRPEARETIWSEIGRARMQLAIHQNPENWPDDVSENGVGAPVALMEAMTHALLAVAIALIERGDS